MPESHTSRRSAHALVERAAGKPATTRLKHLRAPLIATLGLLLVVSPFAFAGAASARSGRGADLHREATSIGAGSSGARCTRSRALLLAPGCRASRRDRPLSSIVTAAAKTRALMLRRLATTRHEMRAHSAAAPPADTATSTPGIDPDAYACDEPAYINFEGLPNGYDLSAGAIGGVSFTTTGGHTWLVGDFISGAYNGKYPHGDYTSEGTAWAWLGTNEGQGDIDFVNGPASYFSLLTSSGTAVQLYGYNAAGQLIASAGPSAPNYSTGTMDELRITRATPDLAFIIVRGDGNYFNVDSVCTDAPGTYTTPLGGPVPDQMDGNPSMDLVQCETGSYPVNCATGDFWHTFADISLPARGVSLAVKRTYNSALAGDDGPFGFGWSSNVAMSARVDAGAVTIHQEDGSTVTFTSNGSSGFTAPARVLAGLARGPDGSYVFTRRDLDSYTFSSTGQLLAVADRNGNAVTFTYDAGGRLASEADGSGRAITFTHDASGRIASATDPDGNVTSYQYDAVGNLTDVIDGLGRHWQFTYDAAHRMATMRQPRYYGDTSTSPSPVITNTYDGAGRVVAQSDPLGRTTTFDYTSQPGSTVITHPAGDVSIETYANGELVALTKAAGTASAATWRYSYDPATLGITRTVDPDGYVTSNTYDAAGNRLTSTDALGHRTSFTYNSLDEITSQTDALGTTSRCTYDAAGNLLSKSTPLSGGTTAKWSYTYGSGSSAGEITSRTDPNGHTTTYGYDAAGDQTSATDPLGNMTTETYDRDGLLLTHTTPLGVTTSHSYDADGERTATTDALGAQTSYGYDGNGDQRSVTDPDGHRTMFGFDADGEQNEVTHPDGATAVTTYDADGHMLTQTDGNGHTTTYAYDPLGRVVSSTDPDGRTTSFSYDPAGNLLASIDPSGATTSFTYDEDNRQVGVAYSDGVTPNVSESYDADGRRTAMTDGSGTSTFAYDTLGNLASETDGAGDAISYLRDPAGNVTSITYPNGQAVTRTFDADERLSSVTDWLGSTTTFAYDGDGDQTIETAPGSVTSRAAYDAAGRLSGITDQSSAGTLASFAYTTDAAGLTASAVVSGVISGTDAYGYDADNRLQADNAATYGYDAADEPTSYAQSQAQTFDAAGELTSSGPEPSNGGPATGGGGAGALGGTRAAGGTVGAAGAAGARAGTPGSLTPEAVVSTHSVGRRGRLVTPRLSTRQSGDLLLALQAGSGREAIGAPVGAGLHWRLVARRHATSGLVTIYAAVAPNSLARVALSSRVTGARPYSALLEVVALAPGTTIAKAKSGNAANAAPRLTFVAAAGTRIWAIGHAASAKAAVTPHAGNSLAGRVVASKHGGTSWVQTASFPTAGTRVVGDQARRAGGWVLAGVVIQAAPDGGAAAKAATASAHALQVAAASPQAAAADQLPTSTSDERLYAYNAAGDRIAISGARPAMTLGYDQANRLTSVDGDISYSYDGDGLRVTKTVDGAATRFTWDESGSTPLVLQDGTTYYLYGVGTDPIEQIVAGTPTYLLADRQGSTRLLTDVTGDVVGTYSYDPWGNVTGHSGSAATNLQYAGQYTDAETGFQYLRARYYDPATGQFLTRDPAEPLTQQPYNYTGDSPVDATDPTGLLTIGLCAMGTALWGPGVLAGGSGTICVVGDTSGDIGVTGTAGPMVGLGTPDLDAAVGLQVSNADQIKQLCGWFDETNGAVAVGEGVAAGTFSGKDSNGTPISGYTVGPAFGLGGVGYSGKTYTETYSINLPSLINGILDRLFSH